MRKLNSNEIAIIKRDIKDLVKFCLDNNLINNSFKERYNGLNFVISDISEVKDAEGKVNHIDKCISLKDIYMSDDYMRRSILYHEIGHLLFDYTVMSEQDQKKIKERVLERAKELSNINPLLALSGFNLFQEYITEKFGTLVTYVSLNRKIETRSDRKSPISGDFTYSTTFHSKYGIIETICDDLLDKTYSSLIQILEDCLNSKFYPGLFEKYDEASLIRILEKMGLVYNILDSYGAGQEVTNPDIAKNALTQLQEEVASINVKKVDNNMGQISIS